MAGTNLFAEKNSTVKVALTDDSDNAILIKCTVANIPTSAAGYSIGCLAITEAGVLYTNTGTAASATWTIVGSQS